jgi:Spy/CpxP family protein refolding chaperone
MRSLSKMVVLAVLALGVSSVALAKEPAVPTHHCMKDGTEMADKTKKECKKEGGKWEKKAAEPKPATDK